MGGSRKMLTWAPFIFGALTLAVLIPVYQAFEAKVFQSVNDRVRSELHADMQLLGGQISANVSSAITLSDLIASDVGEQPQVASLSSLPQPLPYLRTVIVVNPDGVIVADARDGAPGVGIDVADRDYFRAHLEPGAGNVHISGPIKSRVDSKFTWTASQANRNADGALRDVVVASFHSTMLSDIFQEDFADVADGLVLSSPSGMILSASGELESLVGEITEASKTFSKNVLEPLSAYRGNYEDLYQKEYITVGLGALPLHVSALLSPDYVLAKFNQEREGIRFWFLVIAGVVVLASFVIWWSQRRLVMAYEHIEGMLDEMSVIHQQSSTATVAKMEFLANMSHELRTPLNAIIGFSQTIKDGIFGPLGNDKYHEYAEDIHGAGQHLLQIVNNVLDVSALEAGKLELVEEPNSLTGLIQNAVSIVQHRADEKGIRLDVASPDEDLILVCDELRIKQVFLNILSNAVKFTPEDGTVSCKVDLADDGSGRVVISDTGIGMDAAGIEKALEPFGQVDASLSRTHEGTGLGLPLAKDLMELHGGALQVESVPGQGTSITLTFPASKMQDSQAA